MNHLEEQILDIIEKRYKRKYVGGITVTKLLSGYKLVLDLGNPDKRVIQISADLNSEEDFLKFIEQELISRQLEKVQFFRGIVNYPEEDEERLTCTQN
jgi:hypothetical protein